MRFPRLSIITGFSRLISSVPSTVPNLNFHPEPSVFKAMTGSTANVFLSSPHCVRNFHGTPAAAVSLNYIHRKGPIIKYRPKRSLLGECPQLKGVVLKLVIKKPKKPNSANRRCVQVRLSNGKIAIAYVPGIGHNLQEHNIVLVENSRLQDVPGVRLRVIRGKYDCAHVIKQSKI